MPSAAPPAARWGRPSDRAGPELESLFPKSFFEISAKCDAGEIPGLHLRGDWPVAPAWVQNPFPACRLLIEHLGAIGKVEPTAG